MRWYVFSLLCFVGVTSARGHDFHAGLAEVHYNAQTQAFEVSLRVFTDDLGEALRAAFPDADLDELAQADALPAAYLRSRFQMKEAGRPLPFTFVGAEEEVDVTWLYFTFACADPQRVTRLRNAVLIEQFSDQTNLVNVTLEGDRRSYVLRKGRAEVDL